MAIDYHFNALEILKILGGKPSPDYTPDPRLPAVLNEFLSMAKDNRLFKTADIWTDRAYFSYEDIEERIEEDKDFWAEHPDECGEDEFFRLSQTPREQWPVGNYLQIGSDFAAGVVVFGIREEDLGQENPPVYMLHEMDEPTGWKLFSETLSGFLMYILCGGILCCECYNTAQTVLAGQGWTYEECEKPEDIAVLYQYVETLAVACGYDAETNTLLPVLMDSGCKAYRITKAS